MIAKCVWIGLAVAFAAAAQSAPEDPWKTSELVQPKEFAARLADTTPKPLILYVGFPVLYRNSHIPGAILAGPVSKPEGLDALRQAVAKVPHDAEIVIYCGCCPVEHCPNIRPAYAELRKMGFDKVRVLSIPMNMSKDWITKGYPIEK
jgi:3-mercaptopyruvate sulfurtransferase SseA